MGSVDLGLAQRILDRGWSLALVVGCPLPRSVETGELGWQSAPLGLNIELGGQSQSSCAILLQSLGSKASVCPHAQYLARLGDGAVSCMLRVPFWQAQARVLCWCNAACLLAKDRLSKPIRLVGIGLLDSALHNCGIVVSQTSLTSCAHGHALSAASH